ncbi:MAG: hypothetical protein JRE36_11940 [Deltaproteobacteria bacterium]|nr:hypothetical protein [Deltaproteobacteria bacterium]
MESRKKKAAAIAAVVSYLKTEQEAVAMQAAAAPYVEHPPGAHPSAPQLKVWGISGRQAQMQMRNMMQMKTFK